MLVNLCIKDNRLNDFKMLMININLRKGFVLISEVSIVTGYSLR